MLQRDTEFLCKHNIMDYSFFLVIEYLSDKELYLSIRPENSNREPNQKTEEEISSFMKTQRTVSNLSVFTYLGPGKRNTLLSQDRKMRYHFGIIDYLQDWNLGKKGERFYKTYVLRQNPKLMSCAEPVLYRKRFIQRILHNILSPPQSIIQPIIVFPQDIEFRVALRKKVISNELPRRTGASDMQTVGETNEQGTLSSNQGMHKNAKNIQTIVLSDGELQPQKDSQVLRDADEQDNGDDKADNIFASVRKSIHVEMVDHED